MFQLQWLAKKDSITYFIFHYRNKKNNRTTMDIEKERKKDDT